MIKWAGAWVLLCASAAYAGDEKTIQKVSLSVGKSTIELLLTRARVADGGLQLRLVPKGGKPAPLVLYSGGGEDDGPGDADVRALSASAFDLGERKLVRIDFTYRMPGGSKRDEQTDSMLVAPEGKLTKLIELRTQLAHDRSKVCRDLEQTILSSEVIAGVSTLIATTVKKTDPALGDDDLPVDKSCKPAPGETRVLYQLVGDKLVKRDGTPAPANPSSDDSDD